MMFSLVVSGIKPLRFEGELLGENDTIRIIER